MTIKTIRRIKQLRKIVTGWHGAGQSVALVPTMGGLHKGHLQLVRRAQKIADHVIVSLFVNPAQFNKKADLARYPRDEKTDRDILKALGVEVLYAPDVSEMYPPGFATGVGVAGMSDILCGAFRPGHFEGVATIVTKLFLQAGADFACFGEKDFQQLFVVRRLVADLDIPLKIIGVPTVREKSGLAMSSRNRRIPKQFQKIAPELYASLTRTREAIRNGKPISKACNSAKAGLLKAGFSKVEYLELRSEKNLMPMKKLDEPARLMAAVWLGGVRLIDNIAVR